MSLKCARLWLAAWTLTLLAGLPALGQGMEDVQLFAPEIPTSYGGGVRPSEGLFIVFDGLYWTVQAPKVATFGQDANQSVFVAVDPNPVTSPNETTITQQSSLNTSFLNTAWTGGQRYELGYVSGHEGWQLGYFNLHAVNFSETRPDVMMDVDDKQWGAGNFTHLDGHTTAVNTAAGINELAVKFDLATLGSVTKVWGIEGNYVIRQHPGELGFLWEWYLGARYIEFNEDFNAFATGGQLGDLQLTNTALNHIVGPQLGLRIFRQHTNRWSFVTEGRFVAGVNEQTIRLDGSLASNLDTLTFPRGSIQPLAMQGMQFADRAHLVEFTPVVELRIEAKYQVTSSINARVGWSGMWLNNIARPSNMVDYVLAETSTFGIRADQNKQSVILNGVTAGVDFNY